MCLYENIPHSTSVELGIDSQQKKKEMEEISMLCETNLRLSIKIAAYHQWFKNSH